MSDIQEKEGIKEEQEAKHPLVEPVVHEYLDKYPPFKPSNE